MIIKTILIFLIVFKCLYSEEIFSLDCSTLSEEGISEWITAGKVVVQNLHTTKKKEATIKMNFNFDNILPCYSEKSPSKHVCENNCTYLLRLINIENEKTFLSSISSKFLIDKRFNEKLELFLNLDDEIMGFSYLISSYLEKHQLNEFPTIMLSEPFEAPQMHFTSEEETFKEKSGGAVVEDPQEQSFFKKYFWYIVIGGVLFFMFSSIDKDKLNETMKVAQEQTAARQK